MMIWCDVHNAEFRSLGLTRDVLCVLAWLCASVFFAARPPQAPTGGGSRLQLAGHVPNLAEVTNMAQRAAGRRASGSSAAGLRMPAGMGV